MTQEKIEEEEGLSSRRKDALLLFCIYIWKRVCYVIAKLCSMYNPYEVS